MMGWDLVGFNIDQRGGLVSPFEFEIIFSSGTQPGAPLRVSGVLLRTGSVRFEHEDELRHSVAQLGLNAEQFLDYLADLIISRTYKSQAEA